MAANMTTSVSVIVRVGVTYPSSSTHSSKYLPLISITVSFQPSAFEFRLSSLRFFGRTLSDTEKLLLEFLVIPQGVWITLKNNSPHLHNVAHIEEIE